MFDAGGRWSFQGPTGAERYLIVYQNNADPNAVGSGVVNADGVVAEVNRLKQEGSTSRWGILDFEAPFDEILINGTSDPRYSAAVASLIGTIRRVKSEFPDMKWTYFGFPNLPYHPTGKDWGVIPDDQKNLIFDSFNGGYGPVLDELDFIMPCVYDVYESALNMPQSYSQPDVAESTARVSKIESIKRHFSIRGLPVPPIIPAASPWFQTGGGTGAAHPWKAIPIIEFMRDQVAPCLDAGASGFALWGAMPYFNAVATTPPQPNWPAYLVAEQAAIREGLMEALGVPSGSVVSWTDSTTRATLEGAGDLVMTEAIRQIQIAAAARQPNTVANSTTP